MEKNNQILDFLSKRISDGGYVILNNSDYEFLVKTYEKNEILESLIKIFISNRNKKSIYKEISIEKIKKDFISLSKKNIDFISGENKNILHKNKYNFNIGECLGITQLGHQFNDISNYFHIENRMKCGGYDRISPEQIWNGVGLSDEEWKHYLRGYLSPLFRSVNDKKRITEHEYRFCFRLSSTVYQAPQFKPDVAKVIIEKFSKTGRVLDFSCGWGDRLAGFYASKNGTFYLGTDPNRELYDNYQKQIYLYKSLGSKKDSLILTLPAEDVDWGKYNNFDLVFTSPPYFFTELYAKNTEFKYLQSWYRYKNFDDWKNKFLFKTIENILPALTNDAIVAINITDIKIKNKNYLICDDLYSFMIKNGFSYLGYVGMRIKQRPKNVSFDENKKYMESFYIEPIWIYKKIPQ